MNPTPRDDLGALVRALLNVPRADGEIDATIANIKRYVALHVRERGYPRADDYMCGQIADCAIEREIKSHYKTIHHFYQHITDLGVNGEIEFAMHVLHTIHNPEEYERRDFPKPF